MSSNAREYLRELLPPLLPEVWRFIPAQRMPETIDRVTVALKLAAFEPAPIAPIGSLMNEAVLAIASPLTDIEKAEDALDDQVRDLCAALDALDRVQWSRAVKVDDPHLGWDITLNIREDKE